MFEKTNFGKKISKGNLNLFKHMGLKRKEEIIKSDSRDLFTANVNMVLRIKFILTIS